MTSQPMWEQIKSARISRSGLIGLAAGIGLGLALGLSLIHISEPTRPY